MVILAGPKVIYKRGGLQEGALKKSHNKGEKAHIVDVHRIPLNNGQSQQYRYEYVLKMDNGGVERIACDAEVTLKTKGDGKKCDNYNLWGDMQQSLYESIYGAGTWFGKQGSRKGKKGGTCDLYEGREVYRRFCPGIYSF